jgi:Uncharacterised nucleotidyltransferase
MERYGSLQAQFLIDKADRFLADCTRAALAGGTAPPWPDHWVDAAAHDAVAARIGFHGIAVLLGERPGALDGWPLPVADAVRDEMRLAALWEATHRARVVDVIDRLAEAGIAAMVMKGTAVAYLHYGEPATRRRGDTDLLIHTADLAQARTVLATAGGYRRDDPHGLNFQETWQIDCGAGIVHSIDLHWEPADRPVLQKLLQSDRFWSGRVAVPRLSPDVGAPDPVLLLLHGAINQAWHEARGFNVDGDTVVGGRRLIWAVDYQRITAGFSAKDWRNLAEFCEQHDAAAIVNAALGGAQRDLGLPVPPDVLERLRKAATGSPTYAYITQGGVLSEFARDFVAAADTSVRLRLLHSIAFAPRSHLLRKYPHQSRWPTVLLQLRRYVDGVIRIAKGEPRR